MRRTGKAAVVTAVVLGALGFGGVGVAAAEGLPLPIDVVVQLDPTAPTTGELVRGVRDIEGYAEAPEGITRVDLYVVRHSLTNPLTGSVPVATFRPSVPLGRANFDFDWDSAKTPAGLVDIAVVATTTASRSAEARVISVRVEHIAPKAPVASKPKKARATSAQAAPARTTPAAAAAQARAAAVRSLKASPKIQAFEARQAESFYAAFGGVEVLDAAEAPAAAGVLAPLAKASRGAWPSIAVALILLVAAGHVQRAVRVSLA